MEDTKNVVTKKAERINVLTESNNKNFVHAILNAVNKGYADQTIVDDIIDLVKSNEVSEGVMLASPEALRQYADSIEESLNFIADEIENLEVVSPSVKRKRFEEIEDVEGTEKENEEEEEEIKNASKDIVVTEDWEKYTHDEKTNKISGVLNISFVQNMDSYKKDKEIVLKDSARDYVRNKVYAYFKSEYPKLKAKLDGKIFKSGFVVSDNGQAFLNYEIEQAY